jgi:hypothetical protein
MASTHVCREEGNDSSSSLEACTSIFRALESELELDECVLPLAPCEPPVIVLARPGGAIGSVDAPDCPPASSLSITCLQKRVKAGNTAVFALAPSSEAGCSEAHAAVHATLASLVLVRIELQVLDNASSQRAAVMLPAPVQLPVICDPSATHGGVLIRVLVPASAPEGASVVIRCASVAGCTVPLGETPLQFTVGFSHAPARKGPVTAAAADGDVPALMRLLDGGASTEETDRVRRELRWHEPVLTTLARACLDHVLAPPP